MSSLYEEKNISNKKLSARTEPTSYLRLKPLLSDELIKSFHFGKSFSLHPWPVERLPFSKMRGLGNVFFDILEKKQIISFLSHFLLDWPFS